MAEPGDYAIAALVGAWIGGQICSVWHYYENPPFESKLANYALLLTPFPANCAAVCVYKTIKRG
jgi:hypothetical protein